MEGGVESPEGVRYISILYDIYINSILILYIFGFDVGGFARRLIRMFYTWREDGEEGKVRCIEGGCPAITG